MKKNKISLRICGSEYIINSEDDPEYVVALGEELDLKMRALLDQNSRLSVTQAAILCALNFADDFKKADTSAENLRSQIQDYLEDAERAMTDSEITKREVERLGKELASLRAKK
ncbi:MAG: cell division protein ZapA [Clostridiales bacterium]|nr:cell division protein ZapA [Clostridiales bacterium]